MSNNHSIFIGNIINYDQSFFGKVVYNNHKIIEVIKLDNSIKDNELFILPGFIDSHTHGGYGFNFNSLDDYNNQSINNYFSNLYSEGVTNVLFTTITDTLENLKLIGKKINNINNSSLLGWHIEGPFISKIKKGAHNQELIIKGSKQIVDNLLNDFNKKIIFTIAVEEIDYKNIFDKQKINKQIFLSIGHSNANYNQATEAIEYGCNRYTHLFNAMSGFNHREPGIVNVALNNNKGYCEIISDGIHIDNNVVNDTYKSITANRIILVSDSLSVKGLEDRDYYFDNFNITKKGNVSYLINSNTLAGNNMKYIDLVKHFYSITKCSFNEIVSITSLNCAKSLNIDDKFGKIKKAFSSNFVIVDKNLNIKQTIVEGKVVFGSVK